MDPTILGTFICTTFLIVGFFAWFFIHRSKEKERLLLLEKGFEPSDLPKWTSFSFPWLKIGCVITSATIGLILGLFFLHLVDGAAPVIGVVLFGGIGLIIAHYVDKPDEKS